jgi:hypothetical protein
MLFDYFGDLNWLAVIVAAVAYFALGALWYSDVLFGKQWREAAGQGDDPSMNPADLVVNFASWFVAAVALALITKGIGASTVGDGIVLGLVTSIGFIGTHQIVAQVFEGRNTALMRVNAPYNIVGLMLMGVILAVWQ